MNTPHSGLEQVDVSKLQAFDINASAWSQVPQSQTITKERLWSECETRPVSTCV